MVIVLVIVIVLSLAPAVIVWTPLIKKLWIKICLCVLTTAVSIFMLSACMQLNNKSTDYDNAITIGADLLTMIKNEVKCLPTEYNEQAIISCTIDLMEEVKAFNKDYPSLDVYSVESTTD